MTFLVGNNHDDSDDDNDDNDNDASSASAAASDRLMMRQKVLPFAGRWENLRRGKTKKYLVFLFGNSWPAWKTLEEAKENEGEGQRKRRQRQRRRRRRGRRWLSSFFSLIFFLHGSHNDDIDDDGECRDIFNDVKRQKISVMTDV